MLFRTLVLLVFPYCTCATSFDHGVASGDPSENSVVLWTKLDNVDNEQVSVDWEVSKDSSFDVTTNKGVVSALAEEMYAIKVICNQLSPNTTYYYRFKVGSAYSPIGRTKTLPSETEHVRIGVVNCAKFTGGYYNAYSALAEMEVDVVIHLGDYIYESGPSTPQSSYWAAFQATGRQHFPEKEVITPEEYDQRYSQYKRDPDLQKLHSRFPMISIWDDHEIPSSKKGGDWQTRKVGAVKAYHRWLPIRPKPFEPIYRSFQFGNLVNLLMLDARHCCKDEALKTAASLKDTSRHNIGNEQLNWIKKDISRNQATWNIFGNQLLVAKKGKGWERWQGYPYDRSRFLDFIKKNNHLNYLIATGNAHNPHHYVVLDDDRKDTIVHELLPGSISSGNNAEKARYDEAILKKEAKRLDGEDNVVWYHQDTHGFIVLDITKKKTDATWYSVSTVRSKNYNVFVNYSYQFKAK